MNRIITISREFGSGGREVGKRLADALHCAYYDSEIEASIAQNLDLDEGYIARSLESGAFTNIPLHFGRTIASSYLYKQQVDILVEKRKVLREIAIQPQSSGKGDQAGGRPPGEIPREVLPRQVGRPGQLSPVHQHHRPGDQAADPPHRGLCRGVVRHERPAAIKGLASFVFLLYNI